MNDILTADPETHDVRFETNEEGFMVSCWSRPFNCADDCTNGVFIDSVNLGGCDWREVEQENSTATEYIYVLIEDLSPYAMGRSPGVDIDAMFVMMDDVENFATRIIDFSLNGGEFTDPSQALGAADSGCFSTGIVSLGGEGGYLIAEFGTSFQTGDTIVVYELSSHICEYSSLDEGTDYRVSVSTASNNFIEIGTGDLSRNTFVLP